MNFNSQPHGISCTMTYYLIVIVLVALKVSRTLESEDVDSRFLAIDEVLERGYKKPKVLLSDSDSSDEVDLTKRSQHSTLLNLEESYIKTIKEKPTKTKQRSFQTRSHNSDEDDDDDEDDDVDQDFQTAKVVKSQKLIPLMPVFAPEASAAQTKVSTSFVKTIKADSPIIEDHHHRIIYPKPKQISFKY